MEEKELLNEITYLSRLIGRHKITKGYVYPYSSGRNKQFLKKVHSEFSQDTGSKYATSSKYQKINNNLGKPVLGHPDNLKCESTKVALSTSTSTSNVIKDELTSSEKPIGVYKSSIHVNPRYLNDINRIQQIPAIVKSVHVNPKIISISKEMVDLPSQGHSLQNPFCKKETSTSVTPVKQPSCKRYIYRNKTKLVKVPSVSQEAIKEVQNKAELVTRFGQVPVNQMPGKDITASRNDTLLAVSRTKLVRVPVKVKNSTEVKLLGCNFSTSTPIVQTASNKPYKFRRACFNSTQSHAIKTAKKVSLKYRAGGQQSSKYKIDHRLVKTPKLSKIGIANRYQIDRRSIRIRKASPRVVRGLVSRHLLFSPRRSSFGNRVWSASSSSTPKIKISQRRLSRIGNNVSRGGTQNSALVRIGGVLYKTSRTKLTRSKSVEKVATVAPKGRTVVRISERKLNESHIVYVRGNKFEMDSSGRTLKRVLESRQSPISSSISSCNVYNTGRVRRVDIGGVTFIQKTPNLLIRTNTHTARNVLSNAKQKSIAVLARKMRKNNQPCQFYRRLGKCPRLVKGRCELVHDPKYIDVCKKFLQGKCEVKGCLLSHDVIPEKMPTCKFFLENCCLRDFCSYVHVKVNSKAPLCTNFLKGFCPDGMKCLKRHFMVCPDFDKNGSCRKGKFCPYPHPEKRKFLSKKVSDNSEGSVKIHDHPKVKRYYENSAFLEELKASSVTCEPVPLEVSDCSGDESSDSSETPRKRTKIGDLPSFIAFSTSQS